MEPQPQEKLAWPPLGEDLRRLYVEEDLSAAKIAERYGLKYASKKTAESTILYHLKRNGIWRRDKAEHSRKVTEEMVDSWVKKYEAGESLKDIAGEEVSPVMVFNHLKKRGQHLRDKVEAQIQAVTKYERDPFSGSDAERAYILGFVWGDCSVEKHGRAVRVRSGTTHPKFVELFKKLFESHGKIRIYAKRSKVTPAELNLEVDLDGSFEFLLMKNIERVPLVSDASFLSFLAGFSDAEGSIFFHRHRGNFMFQVSNTNLEILLSIKERLVSRGLHPKISVSTSGVLSPTGAISDLWQLGLYRPDEVMKILVVLPLHHKEKVTKKQMALAFLKCQTVLNSDCVPEGWAEYLAEVNLEVDVFVQEALENLRHKDNQ